MIVFVSVRNVGTPVVPCLVRVIGEEIVRVTESVVIPPDCCVCRFYQNSDANSDA